MLSGASKVCMTNIRLMMLSHGLSFNEIHVFRKLCNVPGTISVSSFTKIHGTLWKRASTFWHSSFYFRDEEQSTSVFFAMYYVHMYLIKDPLAQQSFSWNNYFRVECDKLRTEITAQKDDEKKAALTHLSALKDQEIAAVRAGLDSQLLHLRSQVSKLDQSKLDHNKFPVPKTLLLYILLLLLSLLLLMLLSLLLSMLLLLLYYYYYR